MCLCRWCWTIAEPCFCLLGTKLTLLACAGGLAQFDLCAFHVSCTASVHLCMPQQRRLLVRPHHAPRPTTCQQTHPMPAPLLNSPLATSQGAYARGRCAPHRQLEYATTRAGNHQRHTQQTPAHQCRPTTLHEPQTANPQPGRCKKI